MNAFRRDNHIEALSGPTRRKPRRGGLRLLIAGTATTAMLAGSAMPAMGAKYPSGAKSKRSPITTTSAVPTTRPGGAEVVTPSGSKDPLAIGAVLSLTGPSAGIGQEQLAALRVAEKFVNESGGINGRPIRLVARDAGSTDDSAVAAVTALAKGSDDVVAIVGPTLSSQVVAVAPLVERLQLPLIAPSSTAPGIPQLGRSVLRVSEPSTRYIGAAVRHIAKVSAVSKFVVLAADDSGSQTEAAAFEKTVKEIGASAQRGPTLAANSKDFATAVQFVQANRPDAVIISAPQNAVRLIRELRSAKYAGAIIGGNALGVAAALASCGPDCEGMWFSSAYAPTVPGVGVNVKFRTSFRALAGRDPSQLAAQAFSALQVVAESLASADRSGTFRGSLTDMRNAVTTQLHTGQFETPLGRISFDADGDVVHSQAFAACTHIVRGATAETWSGELTYIAA